ncbi:MAG: cytochrome c [Jaaginema sp. PMC 1080.18]|nr:cytochrome c [Jaaginema sp. PMC 1080.18]MEC4868468.1 cytochrome c [Jaaginema sp. PMC 1078.18]
MDDQLIQPKVLLQRLIGVAIAIILAIVIIAIALRAYQMSDPYIQNVLNVKGDPVRGEAIFETNCAGCHGLAGVGQVGPRLTNISKHKSQYNLIQQVISGQTPPMPKFQPEPEDMADLLQYLEQL